MGNCYNSVIVDAPVDKVWATVRDFHDMSWADGVIENLERVGDADGTSIGARRVLNGVFHETLTVLNDADRVVEYTIDDGPGPVARDAVDNYVGHLQLFPVTADGTTYALWTSRYDSPDSDAVQEFCDPIYQALLGALRASFA